MCVCVCVCVCVQLTEYSETYFWLVPVNFRSAGETSMEGTVNTTGTTTTLDT